MITFCPRFNLVYVVWNIIDRNKIVMLDKI